MDVKPDELEEQRKRNAIEMEKRAERIRNFMASEKYPMTPDNPLYNATDDETRAYIRMRREEFMAKGGKWEQHQAAQAQKERERVTVKK